MTGDDGRAGDGLRDTSVRRVEALQEEVRRQLTSEGGG